MTANLPGFHFTIFVIRETSEEPERFAPDIIHIVREHIEEFGIHEDGRCSMARAAA
ncbi:hypothetical protein ACFQX6_41610 [Streptosporangium lutulentum]